ncbi:MAG: ABC transporter ATP-binding protein [Actinomycetota bacterium]|jgi:branched-chain amino acid transport system ATP-binding protein
MSEVAVVPADDTPGVSRRPEEALQVRGLRVSWGAGVAVEGVDLDVRPGRVTCLLGANGAGKSSIVNGITGNAPRIRGSVRFQGCELVGRRPWTIVKAGVVQVPQGRILFPGLTVVENLRMGGFVRGRRATSEGIDYVFELFPRIAERADTPAGKLSGGEQQMVAIGRGLLARPKILLIDEMSLGLAPKIVLQLFEYLHGIAADGLGVLIVEQLAHMALLHSDYAYVMRTGRIVLEGPAADLRSDERVIRMAYLGEEQLEGTASSTNPRPASLGAVSPGRNGAMRLLRRRGDAGRLAHMLGGARATDRPAPAVSVGHGRHR